MTGEEWIRASSTECEEIVKHTSVTRAWFAELDDKPAFAKWYPASLLDTWADIERSISSSNLHRAIVPLRREVECSDGVLFLYDRVKGDNLGRQEERKRFAALTVAERFGAVLDVVVALSAVVQAGFTVVDWYEGNTLYDFEAHRVWLFDWELCRRARSFVLEMDSNYGSSRLMAPEELVRGSVIDGQSLVFNLGRFALLNLPELAEPLASVLAKATYPAKDGRYQSPLEFADALRAYSPAYQS